MADLHTFHRAIGDYVGSKLLPGCSLIKDQACGGEQHIPLFRGPKKSWQDEFCNVDMLILQEQKIRAIIEIEESDIKPHQVCGKLLTSALSRYFIHDGRADKPIGMGEQVVFIEILKISKLKSQSHKPEQFKYLEQSIKDILPLKNSAIKEYHLIIGKLEDMAQIQAELVSRLQTFLQQ
jgi:hypothetical protein